MLGVKFILFFILSLVSSAKNVVVFSATSEIGSAIVKELSADGCEKLLITGRDKSKLTKLKELNPEKIKPYYLDYSDLKSCNAFSKKIEDGIDGVVLIPPRIKVVSAEKIPNAAEWNEMIKMLFINPMACLKNIEPMLNNSASIVLISGSSSVPFNKRYLNTNITRSSMALEAKNLSSQLKDRNIRVNTVSPGYILTSYHTLKMTKEDLKRAQDTWPKPENLANLISFLISDKSLYINGQNIVYDNGSHFMD